MLALAAGRLGWCRLSLHWARPGSLAHGTTVTLNLGEAEHLQCLARLCRFADYCAAAATAAGGHAEAVKQAVAAPVLHTFSFENGGSADGSGGSSCVVFELDPLVGPALDQVLARCSVAVAAVPESGLGGRRLRLQLGVGALHQRQAAAVMIQAAWRGHRSRGRTYVAVKARSGGNRWSAAWDCFKFLRRLAVLRAFAADLFVQRMQVNEQPSGGCKLG